ncbi:hypothetical protein OAC97_02235 [Flavobacteriaceae bacterium]|jgi:hypothetical protein|nr:hypothetical protein [Flavobacteriaceae bacterium]
MEIKVREVNDVESKSVQEVENELLEKHETQQKLEFDDVEKVKPEIPKSNDKIDLSKTKEPVQEKEEVLEKVEEPTKEPYQLKEEDILSFIGERYGKEINSIEELMSAREKSEELPEDVAAYFKYKKETGRSLEDYVKLQQDFSKLDPDSLLKEYLTITEEGLDPEDIDSIMEDYMYDEDLDDESVIKKTRLAKKKIIAKAKRFFSEQQEVYKQPLESRESSASQNEEFKAYKQYVNEAKTQQEESNRKANWFSKKSDDLFGSEFKGFKFNVDDNELLFSPGNASELRKAQDTPMNFVNKFLDDSGMLNNAEGYHRSLAIAMNPDKFASFFYEQGKSNATEDVIRKTKNINMTERTAPEVSTKGGFQVKSVSQPSSRGLRIKSVKRT